MELGLIPFDVSTLKQIHLVYTSTLKQIHLVYTSTLIQIHLLMIVPNSCLRPADQCALDKKAQRDRRVVTNSPTCNGSPVPRLIWVKQVDVVGLYEECT